MKKIILIILSSFYLCVFGVNPEKNDTIPDGGQSNSVIIIPDVDEDNEINEKEPDEPGKIPSFWWSFILSTLGTYTIYGMGIGPLSVLIVYFVSKRNKKEVSKSIWGWVTGTIAGLGIWALIK